MQALNVLADAALMAARTEAKARIAEQQSGLMRWLDSAVTQAALRIRPVPAALALLEKPDMDQPAVSLAAMRTLPDDWHQRGRVQGRG